MVTKQCLVLAYLKGKVENLVCSNRSEFEITWKITHDLIEATILALAPHDRQVSNSAIWCNRLTVSSIPKCLCARTFTVNSEHQTFKNKCVDSSQNCPAWDSVCLLKHISCWTLSIAWDTLNIHVKRYRFSSTSLKWLLGFQEVKVPGSSRHSARWKWQGRHPYAPAAFTPRSIPILIFRSWVDPRVHVSFGSFGKNPQRHHRGSIPRPSD
jgi:hypothetical protein